jgi:hypothetical protein
MANRINPGGNGHAGKGMIDARSLGEGVWCSSPTARAHSRMLNGIMHAASTGVGQVAGQKSESHGLRSSISI